VRDPGLQAGVEFIVEGVPQPYNRADLGVLQATLNARWPKLSREEAEKW
jgi:hypothetical protein